MSEKNYIFDVLFTEILGVPYEVVESSIGQYEIMLPNGNFMIIEDHFFEKHEHWLTKECIPDTADQVSHPFHEKSQLAVIFGRNTFKKAENTWSCGIDVFASAFFMLTRWEEYVNPNRDVHGRFQAKNALAYKAGFLDRPVVNEYAELMGDMFIKLGYIPVRPARQYTTLFTCDIDHPRLWWSWKDKIKTLAASLVVRHSWTEFKRWWPWVLKKEDPYYSVFDTWLDWAKNQDRLCCFNFMGKRSPSSDCYYDIDHPDIKDLILRLNEQGHIIGFHPSYEAFDNPTLFAKELASIQANCPQPVVTGRQHYLRFSVPHTWAVWEDSNMHWDSSLGYAEAEGFRCGICYDFPVYDVVSRKKLTLREKPLILMDVTLTQYRGYTTEQAQAVWQQLATQVKKYNGEFVVLWHNSTPETSLMYAP